MVLLHGIFEFLGIFVAFRYYLWLKRRQGDPIERERRIYVLTGAALGAVLGMRIIGALEDVPAWLAAPSFWLYFYGNKTLVGALLGGLAGVELVKKMACEKAHTGDLFTYPLILGMIIGRIGCFSAGVQEQAYGIPSQLPWAMDLGDGVLRHPVALYEILFLLLLWVGIAQAAKRYQLPQGGLFRLFLISYLLFRFLLDLIKPGWRYFFGLGTIQLACIGGLLYYSAYILHPASITGPKRTHAR